MDVERRLKLIKKAKEQELLNRGKALPVVVSLEDFFIGNDDYGSIGCNLFHHPGPQAFFDTLKSIRDKPEVQDVMVEIHEWKEQGEATWPFSERIYIFSSTTPDQIAAWLSPLEPDEIEEGFPYGVPKAAPKLEPGMRIYAAWWD
jgi:hypothetical protein